VTESARSPISATPAPEIGVGRVEFYRAVNGIQDQFEAQAAGGLGTRRLIGVEADGLRETAGWIAVSFAFWLLIVGYCLISGNVRGRPHRGLRGRPHRG
jgi:hypothetical protein